MKHRYTIELSDNVNDLLIVTANKLQINKSDVVKRGIALVNYLAEEDVKVLRAEIKGKPTDIIL